MTAQSEGDSVVEDPAAASGGKKDKKDRFVTLKFLSQQMKVFFLYIFKNTKCRIYSI